MIDDGHDISDEDVMLRAVECAYEICGVLPRKIDEVTEIITRHMEALLNGEGKAAGGSGFDR